MLCNRNNKDFVLLEKITTNKIIYSIHVLHNCLIHVVTLIEIGSTIPITIEKEYFKTNMEQIKLLGALNLKIINLL